MREAIPTKVHQRALLSTRVQPDEKTGQDASTVDMEYSSNSGTGWNSLAMGVTDTGTFSWDTSFHGDSTTFRTRVMATDAVGNASSWSASAGDLELDNTDPVIALTSPAGGELWDGIHPIVWSTTDSNPSTVTVEISSNSGGAWTGLAAAIADTGSHSWDTSAQTDGAAYRIRVEATDGAGNVSTWSASASDFELDHTDPTILLTAPVGGELWGGSVRNVTWNTTDVNPSTVDIEVSSNSGGAWTAVATGVADTGIYPWDTSVLGDSTTHRVRVMATDGVSRTSAWSVSSSDFELDNTLPTITLTAPVGAEVWRTTHNVTWT